MTDSDPQSLPKCPPNRTKTRPTIDAKNEAKKEPKSDRLGAVLGRSWVIFGFFLGSKILIFHWFLSGFVQNHVFWKISVWNPSWPDLGPIWGQLDAQNGSKMAPKIDQKTNKRTTRKKNTKRKKKEAQESVKSRHAGHLWVVGASLHLTQLWTESGGFKRFPLSKPFGAYFIVLFFKIQNKHVIFT